MTSLPLHSSMNSAMDSQILLCGRVLKPGYNRQKVKLQNPVSIYTDLLDALAEQTNSIKVTTRVTNNI